MTIEEAKQRGYDIVCPSDYEFGLAKNAMVLRRWCWSEFDRKAPELDHPLIQEAIRLIEIGEAHCRQRDERRVAMRSTPAGKLLVRYGFEPYDTVTPARTVAEKAAADIAELEKLVRDYVRASEEDNDLGEALAFDAMRAWVREHPNT